MMCQQCDTASCVKVCPTHAMAPRSGTTLVEYTKGPVHRLPHVYHRLPVRHAVYDKWTDRFSKCDTAAATRRAVAYCPSQALEFVDDNIATRSRKKAFATKFKEAFQEA